MKRITMFIATLAIGFAFVACGGSSDSKKDESKSDKASASEKTENLKDPAALINETFKSLYDALDDDTPDNFIRIFTEMKKLYESSSADLQKQFDKAEEDWFKKNPSKAQDLNEEVKRLYEMGFLNDSTSDDDSYGDDYSYYDDDDDYSYYDDDDDDYSYYDDDDALYDAIDDDTPDSKKSDPASKVEEIFNSLYDALDDDTPDNFIRIYTEMNKLYESSSVDVQAKMDEASDRWYENNPSKAEKIVEALSVLYEMGFLNDSTSDDDSYGDDYSYYDDDDDDYSYYDDDDDDYSYYDDDDYSY